MKQRYCRRRSFLGPLLLVVVLAASSCTAVNAGNENAVEPATTFEIPPEPTRVPPTPTPVPTPMPTIEPVPVDGVDQEPPEDGEWPIRIESPNVPTGWPDTPLPATREEQDAREAELLELLAAPDLDFDDRNLWRLELTRLRQPKAEQIALEYRELTFEILMNPIGVDRDELDRITELSNPDTSLRTYGERLLVETIDEDNEYLDDEFPTETEIVGSVMNGFSVLVTLCTETTGIWRSLTTGHVTRETGARPVNSIYEISTIEDQMHVIHLTTQGADEGCSLVERWPGVGDPPSS